MDLLDGQLRLNGAFFKTNYEELQVQVFNSVAPVTQNIGEASIEGFELELSASPAEGWFIEGSLSLLDAEYDTIDTANTLIFKVMSLSAFQKQPQALAYLENFRSAMPAPCYFALTGVTALKPSTTPITPRYLETDSYSLIDASAAMD